MPPQPVVSVESLGKRYRIGVEHRTDETLVSTVVRALASPAANLRRIRQLTRFSDEDTPDVLWALRDVTFDVDRGEVLGIIGRNGAGKTTLLKILSQITEPTLGRVVLRGRVASLLQVGTGFHPDLSGRDNVYLNASILGLPRRQTARRFDEIVEFSEIGRFIDTPVKRYSSGMYVRLAFAVAAHLDPDILIADEVLAVGDVGFQKKCLGKMREVAGGGRTVIFVSHDRAAVTSLCTRAIWMDGGRIRADGDTDSVMARYVHSFAPAHAADLSARTDRVGDGRLRFTRIEFRDARGEPTTVLRAGEPAEVVIDYVTDGAPPTRDVEVAVVLETEVGDRIATLSNRYTGDELAPLPPAGSIVCRIDVVPLNEGDYACSLKAWVARRVADRVTEAARFSVDPSTYYATRLNPTAEAGALLLRHSWTASSSRVGADRAAEASRH